MPVQLEMFPPVMEALQKEMVRHPSLMAAMSTLGQYAPLEEKVGMIAAYCDVLLDGYYNEAELAKLMEILLGKLRSKSAIIVTS